MNSNKHMVSRTSYGTARFYEWAEIGIPEDIKEEEIAQWLEDNQDEIEWKETPVTFVNGWDDEGWEYMVEEK